MSKKHQNLSFFDHFVVFGAISCHFEIKKNHKNLTQKAQIARKLFFRFLHKKCKKLPYWADFCVFFTMGIWKKTDFARVESILSKKFKDVNTLNPYEYGTWRFDGTFQFFLDFEVHFLENRFPNLFQKTTRVFNWKRKLFF